MSCFKLLELESLDYFERARPTGQSFLDLSGTATADPTLSICHGVLLEQFAQRVRAFCKLDKMLEADLIKVAHPRDKLLDLIEVCDPLMIEMHFIERVEEEAMGCDFWPDEDVVRLFFADKKAHLTLMINELFHVPSVGPAQPPSSDSVVKHVNENEEQSRDRGPRPPGF